MNEEDRYAESGSLYGKYSNLLSCGEATGRYMVNSANNRVTWDWSINGNSMYNDWKLENASKYQFTIQSDVAILTYGKIVETYNMEVGQTVNAQFGKNEGVMIQEYSSTNDRIASVTSTGEITAAGEKGTAYIKMKTEDYTVWGKVVVGDECADLWYDYVSIIGVSYKDMRNALSGLGEPYSGDDGYSFGFVQNGHNYIDMVKVFVDKKQDIINEIQLVLKESIPEAQILSYMDSRYYKMKEDNMYVFYSTFSDVNTSKAIVAYNKSDKTVYILETQNFLHHDLWTDFTSMFGFSKAEVKSAMDKYGCQFLMSDNSYSKDGSDYYEIVDNDYAYMVGFVFNPDKLVSEFWVYMDTTSDPNDVYDYLCTKYTENKSESSQYELVFYNDDKSMKVTFDLKSGAVVYKKLTMKQHEGNNEILGNYYEGLGMTHNQIIAKYGTPYSDDGNTMFYIVGSEYVNLAAFYMDAETSKCKQSVVIINENVATSTIIDYLNSKYTVFASGTAADGSQYVWINGSNKAESTIGIIYYPEDRMVTYIPLGSPANTIPLDSKNIRSLSVMKMSDLLNRKNK